MNPLISSAELADRAGVTFRQIDHWSRIGIIWPHVEARGSGTRRRFDRDTIGQCAVLGRVSRALSSAGNNGAPHGILVAVAEHWRDGHLELDENVKISWTVEDLETRMDGHGR